MFVSVIIPAFNEAARLPLTLSATVNYFTARKEALGEAFEVLVVDDGSTDGTAAVVIDYAASHPKPGVQCLS